MSLKNMEVYEYYRLLRRQKRSLPQAAALAARFVTRLNRGNLQRRAQADKQWADV